MPTGWAITSENSNGTTADLTGNGILTGLDVSGNMTTLNFGVRETVPDVYTQVDAPASVALGDPVTTLLTFGNQGITAAEGVIYTVTLPTGLAGVSCTGATCSYNSTTGALTITGLPNVLIPGQVEQVIVSYTAPSPGPLGVTAAIATITAGDPTGNNSATDSTTVSNSVVDVAAWLNVPPSALTGETVNVPVNFTNLGGVTAEGVTYSLTLPDKPSVATCTGSGVTCSYNSSTGEVTITGLPNTLAPGQTVGLILSYTAPAASSSPVDVIATVSATDDSRTDGNNTATGETVINATPTAPDIISLVAPPATAVPGSTVTVPVSYSNLGPDPATVTQYKLELTGAAVSGVEIRNNGALCTYNLDTGALSDCGLPTILVPGQTVDLVLTYIALENGNVTVSSDITATGLAPGNAAETNTANNPSSGATSIATAAVPDVYTNVDVPATVPPSGTINALVTFGNQGLVPADGVTYAMTLPPGLSGAVDCTGATCVYDSATGLLILSGLPASLSPGHSETVLISYPAPASGTISLESVIATTTVGETPTNNNRAQASTAVTGSPAADVTTWIDAPATAASGSPVTVTAGFTNLGTADAETVTYKLAFTGSPTNIAVTHNGTACTYNSGTGAVSGCGLPGTLLPGQIVNLVATYTARVSGPVVVTSTVVSAPVDSDTSNNTASASTVIPSGLPPTEADVTATVAPPPTATAGSTVTVPVTFANLGPLPATITSYILSLTGSPDDVVVTYQGAACTYSSGVALAGCGLPTTLSPGETLPLTATYTAPGSGSVEIVSTINTSTNESNSLNNTATGLTTIPASLPNVDVYALIDAPATAAAGNPVNVKLTFGNAGSGFANGVSYRALLPAGLTGVSCSVACDYDSASGLVTISGLSGSLAAGTNAGPITLTYTAPATPGMVPVTARISATGDSGIGGNNSATDRTRIAAASPPPPSSHSIPTLSEWAMLLLLALMMTVGLRYQRRR